MGQNESNVPSNELKADDGGPDAPVRGQRGHSAVQEDRDATKEGLT